MLHSPTPLQEKMTLFWHNHFATSNAKIQSVRLMHGQYELMRKYALGNFGDLLQEMSKDPAMVIWLDTKGSKKGNPNENYARELMELFSLGIGHYSERDIREAALAFTGFDVTGTEVVYREADHDAGDKEVLGQKGRFKGPDIRAHLPGTASRPGVYRTQVIPVLCQRNAGAKCGTDRAPGHPVTEEWFLDLRRGAHDSALEFVLFPSRISYEY